MAELVVERAGASPVGSTAIQRRTVAVNSAKDSRHTAIESAEHAIDSELTPELMELMVEPLAVLQSRVRSAIQANTLVAATFSNWQAKWLATQPPTGCGTSRLTLSRQPTGSSSRSRSHSPNSFSIGSASISASMSSRGTDDHSRRPVARLSMKVANPRGCAGSVAMSVVGGLDVAAAVARHWSGGHMATPLGMISSFIEELFCGSGRALCSDATLALVGALELKRAGAKSLVEAGVGDAPCPLWTEASHRCSLPPDEH